MAFHLGAFYLASSSASATFQPVPAIPDQVLIPQGNGFQIKDPYTLFLSQMHSPGTHLARGQLTSPSMRQITLPEILPVSVNSNPLPTPFRFMDLRRKPFALAMNEEIDVNAINNNATDVVVAALFLGLSMTPPPLGNSFWLHGVATTAAVAYTWTQLSITWDQLPQQGVYSVQGSFHASATGIYHRFLHPGQVQRPGGFSTSTNNAYIQCPFTIPMCPEYLQFPNWQMPLVEVICQTTDASHDVWMNIVKVG